MIYIHYRLLPSSTFTAINDEYGTEDYDWDISQKHVCEDLSETSIRSNLGDDEVSRYLKLDLELPTKKAARETLREHPLAAPRKCARNDKVTKSRRYDRPSAILKANVIRPRANAAITVDEHLTADHDCLAGRHETPSRTHQVPALLLDDEFDELQSDISWPETEIDSAIDDEDLLQLDCAMVTVPPKPLTQSQGQEARHRLPTPPASEQPVPKTSSAKPPIQTQVDIDEDDWLFDDDPQLEKIDLSTVAKFPQDSPLIPQPRPPIQRAPFPDTVGSHSPITGLSADTCLRTCFRIGEALNAGCNAVRQNRNILLDLFARVSSSRFVHGKSSRQQYFQLFDLFHDKTPHVEAVYESAGKRVLDTHAGNFLGLDLSSPLICRCTGKMERRNGKWVLVLLGIRSAQWDEIDYVAGIYGT